MASRRNGRNYLRDEDFEEEEVWGVMEERENLSPELRKPSKNSSFFSHSSSATKHFTSAAVAAPRMIPRSSSSSSSSVVDASERKSSAPMEIPDWSKIYGKTYKQKKNGISASSWVDYNAVNHDGYYANGGDDVHDHLPNGCYDDGDDDDDDDDEDDDDMLPPHEFLAKKLARSQIASFSVYEGIGRTLKGRDLSKVRNAILTKTGFLE